MTPEPTDRVIGREMDAGRVRVHDYDMTLMTRCGQRPDWSKSWLWLEYRTLNPDRVVLCKSCYQSEKKP